MSTPTAAALRIPLLLLLLSFGCSLYAADPPTWWTNRSLVPDTGEVIGYGTGPDVPSAITAALGDAAFQRRSLVRSSTSVSSSDAGKVVRSSSTRVSAYGSLLATHTRVLQQAVLPDGSVYVSVASVSLESVPLLAYLANHAGFAPCTSPQATNLLTGSKLLRDVQDAFGCDPGARLRYGPDGWSLSVGPVVAPLDGSRLPDVFGDIDSPELHLTIDPSSRGQDRTFVLTWHAYARGSLTAVLVDDLGAVRLLGRSSTSSDSSGTFDFDAPPSLPLHVNPSMVLAAVCPWSLSPAYMVSSGTGGSSIGVRPALASLLDELQASTHCTYSAQRLLITP